MVAYEEDHKEEVPVISMRVNIPLNLAGVFMEWWFRNLPVGAPCGPLKHYSKEPVSRIRSPSRPTPLDGLNWVLTSYGLPKVWVKEGLTTVCVIGPWCQ